MAAVGMYNFTQTTPDTTWTITHNLNSTAVNIDVNVLYNGAIEKILPQSIVNIDANTVTVTFGSARTGNARVIATI